MLSRRHSWSVCTQVGAALASMDEAVLDALVEHVLGGEELDSSA
jgi:hypothetical protein